MVEDKCQDFCQNCHAKKIDYSLPKYVIIGSIFATISDLLYAFSAQVDLTVLTKAQCTQPVGIYLIITNIIWKKIVLHQMMIMLSPAEQSNKRWPVLELTDLQ